MSLSINVLIVIAFLALCLLLAPWYFKVVIWGIEVHQARLRRRHAARRRERAKGYVPVYDDRWEPRP